VALLPPQAADVASALFGFVLLAVVSYGTALGHGSPPLPLILEHLTVAGVVVVISNYLGSFLTVRF
jgi:hypothetical protein